MELRQLFNVQLIRKAERVSALEGDSVTMDFVGVKLEYQLVLDEMHATALVMMNGGQLDKVDVDDRVRRFMTEAQQAAQMQHRQRATSQAARGKRKLEQILAELGHNKE